MFNISILSNELAADFSPLEEGDGEIKVIGTLNLYDRAIKFTFNYSVIYANGMPIIPTYNDRWTAAATFAKTMQASFGDDFVLEQDFHP